MTKIRLTLAELDVAVSALEILSPDTAEGQDLIDAFEATLRAKTDELQSLSIESRADPEACGGEIYEIPVSADENAWFALADGLDVIRPDEEEAADLAESLASKVRSHFEAPSPSL